MIMDLTDLTKRLRRPLKEGADVELAPQNFGIQQKSSDVGEAVSGFITPWESQRFQESNTVTIS